MKHTLNSAENAIGDYRCVPHGDPDLPLRSGVVPSSYAPDLTSPVLLRSLQFLNFRNCRKMELGMELISIPLNQLTRRLVRGNSAEVTENSVTFAYGLRFAQTWRLRTRFLEHYASV